MESALCGIFYFKKVVKWCYNTEIYKIQPVEDECIAYVYYDVKFSGIKTLAPGLNRFYLIKDDSDVWKIKLSEFTDAQEQRIEKADESEEVQEMIRKTNEQLEQAVKKDDDLREILNALQGTDEK